MHKNVLLLEGTPEGDKHTHTAEGEHGNPAHVQLFGQA